MRLFFLVLIGIFSMSTASAQGEFEGEIFYLHKFYFKGKDVDTLEMLHAFGSRSKYAYKAGSYKWTFLDCALQTEYCLRQSKVTLNKYDYSDTIYQLPAVKRDTLLSYKILRNAASVLNYPCNVIEVVTGRIGDPNYRFKRRIYYSDNLPINPEHTKHIDAYCNDEVFSIIKAVPLRIDMEMEDWPYEVHMDAEKIMLRTVSDGELQVPSASKVRVL